VVALAPESTPARSAGPVAELGALRRQLDQVGERLRRVGSGAADPTGQPHGELAAVAETLSRIVDQLSGTVGADG
jgi:hypothetical protein